MFISLVNARYLDTASRIGIELTLEECTNVGRPITEKLTIPVIETTLMIIVYLNLFPHSFFFFFLVSFVVMLNQIFLVQVAEEIGTEMKYQKDFLEQLVHNFLENLLFRFCLLAQTQVVAIFRQNSFTLEMLMALDFES